MEVHKFKVLGFRSTPGEESIHIESGEREYHTYQTLYTALPNSEIYFDGIKVKNAGELLQKLSLSDLDILPEGQYYTVMAEVYSDNQYYGACTKANFSVTK